MQLQLPPNAPKPKGFLFIGMCAYRPEVHTAVTDAIEAACMSLAMQGWLSYRVRIGSADLEDSRNILISQFHANPDFTHALLVDSDVSWEPGTVERLLSYPVDFVLGVYPRRADGEGFAVHTKPGGVELIEPVTRKPNPKGLALVNGGPAGLMRISRNVMDKLVAAHPDRWYHQEKVLPTKRAYHFFEFDVHEHKRRSEDMNFCRLWREIGGEVWVDPHLKLHHHGDKTYSGAWIDYLRQIERLSDPQKVVKIEM